MNTTPQNFENIKALATYIDASEQLVTQHKDVCNRMLQQYVEEEYGITLGVSVIPLDYDMGGISYFTPESVNFRVYENGSINIILNGIERFPGRRVVKFSDIEFGDAAFSNLKKGIIYRVEDLPSLLGKKEK